MLLGLYPLVAQLVGHGCVHSALYTCLVLLGKLSAHCLLVDLLGISETLLTHSGGNLRTPELLGRHH